MSFRGLQAESVSQSKVHDSIAKELNALVISPFNEWAQGYKVSLCLLSTPWPTYLCLQDRVEQGKSTVFDNWLRNYEQAQADVQKLKQQYLNKTRRADEAEDELVIISLLPHPNSSSV